MNARDTHECLGLLLDLSLFQIDAIEEGYYMIRWTDPPSSNYEPINLVTSRGIKRSLPREFSDLSVEELEELCGLTPGPFMKARLVWRKKNKALL